MSAYWPPLENLPTFDVLVFRQAQDVVEYAVATGTANNIAGGVAGDLLYQSAPSTTTKLGIGTNTYILTSNGSAPVWTAPTVPSTPTLANVLLAGNSAGATNIDMNTQSITNATAMTAATFNGALNGTASLATNISLGTAGDLLYQSSSNVTTKLGIGSNTFILTSNGSIPQWTAPPVIPGTPTLSAVLLAGNSAGATDINMNSQSITNANNITATTFNGSLNGTANIALRANTIDTTTLPGASAFYYLNYVDTSTGATSRTVYTNSSFYFNPASGVLAGAIINLFGGFANVSATAASRLINNTFYNLMDDTAVSGGTNRGNLTTTSTVASLNLTSATHRFTITNNSGAITTFSIDPADLTITTTNNPTITGFTDPAASNSSNNIASTRWVQSAITAGTSGTATNANNIFLTVNDTATTYFLTFAATGAGYQSLLYDTTASPLSYQPSTSTLTATNFSGLASQSTTVAVADDNTSTTMYPVFTTTGAGQKSLLFDITTNPLSYVPSTSTLTASTFVGALTGLASQSTTVAVADNNTATTMYPVFTTTGAGQKSLLFDSSTTPLRYKPDTSELSALKFTVNGLNTVAGDNAGFIEQDAGISALAIQNEATSGQIHLRVRASTNFLSNSLIISANEAVSTQFSVGNIVNSVAGNNAGFLQQNVAASATTIQNQATSGFIHLAVRNASNTLSDAIVLSTSNLTITTTNSPVISARNVVVDNASGVPITIGNGASTATSNIIMTSGSLASTRNFTTGENVIIGNVAGNALLVASNRNTLLGDSAGSSATGNNNICIGYNSQVPTAANSNQIAIGTASETMYVRGGFNWRIGTQITNSTNGNLSTAVLAQFYTVAMTAASQTITLPNPTTAVYLGARITFKRKTNATVFTFTAAGTTPFLGVGGFAPQASPISIAATVFQVDMVCDGVNWCFFGTG